MAEDMKIAVHMLFGSLRIEQRLVSDEIDPSIVVFESRTIRRSLDAEGTWSTTTTPWEASGRIHHVSAELRVEFGVLPSRPEGC